MMPYKIQLSRVKTALLILLTSGAGTLTPSRSAAQCGGTVATTVYNTTYGATATNTGSIGATYPYTLPEFNSATNTLLAVVIKSTITASAVATVTNNSGSDIGLPYVQLFREDGFNSTPATSGSATISNPVFGTDLPNGSSEVISMPDALQNYQMLYDSVTSSNTHFGSFSGGGSISFNYSTDNIGLPSPNLTVSSLTITDQINFTITYYYCIPGTLATDILTFTATRENDQTALLNWTTSNELPGRNYVIQVSKDGTNFVDSATVPAQGASGDAAYTFNFPLDPSATGNLYFRLKVVDVTGPFHYSQVCIIRLGDGNATGFSIYPNPPTDFINLSFPGGNQNWDVSIYAADGNIVQRNSYPTTNLARVNFNRKMAAGTYFVRAVNPQTNQSFTRSFVINTP
jgi:hypothetical protein